MTKKSIIFIGFDKLVEKLYLYTILQLDNIVSFKDDNVIEKDFIDNDIVICNSKVSNNLELLIKYSSKIILYLIDHIFYTNKPLYNICKNNVINKFIGNVSETLNSIKFPTYLELFDNENIHNINNKVKDPITSSKNFCCMIEDTDEGTNKKGVAIKLHQISKIVFPLKLFNNFSTEEYNKIGYNKFMEKFLFNICSEDYGLMTPGYISDKLFTACLTGVIPISSVNLDEYDKKIFNTERIISFEYNETSLNNLQQYIKKLLLNRSQLLEIYKKDIFNSTAKETFDFLKSNLNKRIKDFINNKQITNNEFINNMDKIPVGLAVIMNNVYDLMDVLITQINPVEDIFNRIEVKFKYNNFTSLRISAEKMSDGSFDDIYNKFKILSNDTSDIIDQIKMYELNDHIYNFVPIMSNVKKLYPDDAIICNTYLPKDTVNTILNNLKVRCDNLIFDNYTSVLHNFIIDKYFGNTLDLNNYNIHSIKSKIFSSNKLKNIIKLKSLETCRLLNPFPEDSLKHKVYNDQFEYNIPMLLYICKKIKNKLESENKNTVIFASRHDYMVYTLFKYIYPDIKTVYLYNSKLIPNSNLEYIEYLKSNCSVNCIIFELYSSLSNIRNVINPQLPTLIWDYDKNTELRNNVEILGNENSSLKYYNLDMHGYIIDYKNNMHLFAPNENPYDMVNLMYIALSVFIKYTNKNIIGTIEYNNDKFWLEYSKNIPIPCYSKVIEKYEEYELTNIANEFGTDKGSKTGDCHQYTTIYRKVISDILLDYVSKNNLQYIDVEPNEDINDLRYYIEYKDIPIKKFKLLEIGLWRLDGVNIYDVPSLRMWNKYFHSNAQIIGFDIIKKLQYHFTNEYKDVTICQGDQSNINDLNKLKNVEYDLITDDGYHFPIFQQITLRELWSCLKPNGYYIIEDLYFENDKYRKHETITRELFKSWQAKKWIDTEYINRYCVNEIKNSIHSIEFFTSKSIYTNCHSHRFIQDSFVYIRKK